VIETLVREHADKVPLGVACAALGLSRATLYRARKPKPEPAPKAPREVPRKLSAEERAAVLSYLHDEEFVDQPPAEIVPRLLERGIYVASVRTFYRILAAENEVRERRALRRHPPAAKPHLVARGPNEVWTWDITKVAGPAPGQWLCVYVLIDLYSRYVVGWMVAERENGRLAARWLRETLAARDVEPKELVVHNDRGAPMTSVPFTQVCAQLGVTQSFSRPRVSDDNAFSEAQFKTLKYQPDFPARFGSLLHARAWLQEFFDWHNEQHQHAGLALFTPGQVYRGEVEAVAAERQKTLDAAYTAHPERFVKGPPKVRRPPAEVWINPVSAAEPIPSPEPAPQASLCPSPATHSRDRAQAEARATKEASEASEPLPRSSTGAPSAVRRAEVGSKGSPH